MESASYEKARRYIFALAFCVVLSIVAVAIMACLGISRFGDSTEYIAVLSWQRQDVLAQLQLEFEKIRAQNSIASNNLADIESAIDNSEKRLVDLMQLDDLSPEERKLIEEIRHNMRLYSDLYNSSEAVSEALTAEEADLSNFIIGHIQYLRDLTQARAYEHIDSERAAARTFIVLIIICTVTAAVVLVAVLSALTAAMRAIQEDAVNDIRPSKNSPAEFDAQIQQLKVVAYDLSKIVNKLGSHF